MHLMLDLQEDWGSITWRKRTPLGVMGSFRRPRPRFMSSPVLTDLARFHASSPALQLSNASVWNSVQSAVMKVFQGVSLQPNELFTLNESIRWLLKTELGSFITEYFQNQLLNKGLTYILEKIQLYDGDDQLLILSEMWTRFFTETLPTLQAIFYPVQGQELTVRQMTLLGFRDQVLLKLHLEMLLPKAPLPHPPPITQMLLILQGVHEPNGPTEQYCLLETLVAMVISPYLGNYVNWSKNGPPSEYSLASSCSRPLYGQPEIMITQFLADPLAPLVEHDGEAYLEKAGGIRRHTVANAHSDIQLLNQQANRMHCGTGESVGSMTGKTFSSEPDILESPGGVLSRRQSSSDLMCAPPS